MGCRCMRILLWWLLCDGFIFGPLRAVDGSPLFPDPTKVRSTDRPCTLYICNKARSFTHESNTCVIRRRVFLILGYIDLLSCTLPPATLLLTIFGRAQGLGIAPERRRCSTVAEGSSVLIHCGSFERNSDRVRQRPPWLCSRTFWATQCIFRRFWVSERLQSEKFSIHGLVCWFWPGCQVYPWHKKMIGESHHLSF